MGDWKYLKDELPEVGSKIEYAEFVAKNPLPNIYEVEIDNSKIKDISESADDRDMWKYISRARKEDDNLDLYKRENVNFSIADINDETWEEYRKQRIERGFDDTEFWNLDSTILQFALPRLRAWIAKRPVGYPNYDEASTFEGWMEVLEKIAWWMEHYINGDEPNPNTKELEEYMKKMAEGKKLFFKYFENLWD